MAPGFVLSSRALGIGSALVWTWLIISALRTGKAQLSSLAKDTVRKNQPAAFYAVLAVYAALLLLSIYDVIHPLPK